MQIGDAMQKIKNACSVNDTACTMNAGSFTPHAPSTNDSNGSIKKTYMFSNYPTPPLKNKYKGGA
jgi:hypothetical protein